MPLSSRPTVVPSLRALGAPASFGRHPQRLSGVFGGGVGGAFIFLLSIRLVPSVAATAQNYLHPSGLRPSEWRL